jgi:hypothetical protein
MIAESTAIYAFLGHLVWAIYKSGPNGSGLIFEVIWSLALLVLWYSMSNVFPISLRSIPWSIGALVGILILFALSPAQKLWCRTERSDAEHKALDILYPIPRNPSDDGDDTSEPITVEFVLSIINNSFLLLYCLPS